MKPQNQVTVRSSETGLVFQMNRTLAEKHDTLTILDDLHDGEGFPIKGWNPKTVEGGKEGRIRPIKVKSVDKPADPIAAPVADDN